MPGTLVFVEVATRQPGARRPRTLACGPGGERCDGRVRATVRSPISKRARVNVRTVRRLALALPEVEEGPCYGTPGFRVKGRFLARLWEDGETLVVKCGDEERDFRIQADPKTFFVTDHYRGYPTVLVHLARVSLSDLRDVLEEAWRQNAPKRLIAARNERRKAGKGAARSRPHR